MDDRQPTPPKKERSWRQFQKVALDRKRFSKHVSKVESATTRHAQQFVLKRISNIRFVRQRIIAWFLAVALILGGIGVQYFWDGNQHTVSASTTGGTYAEGVVGSIETLNPLQASSSAEVAASRLMFSSLYRYDPTGNLRSDVAANMSVDKKGESYILKIRDDVYWHDGEKLTADDVLFTINTIKNPDSLSRASLQTNWQDIKVKVLDERTIQFTLPSYAAFPHALTFPIVPKHLLARVEPGSIGSSSFATEPVGSGPFIFKLLQNADRASSHKAVHMLANQNYYRAPPKLSRFELHAYPNEDSLVSALRSTEVTAAADVSSSSLDKINRKTYTVESHSLDNGVYLLINNTNPILKQKEVRKALQLGIDTDKIRQAVGGQVPEMGLPFLDSHYSGKDVPKAPKYNLAEAKVTLDKAKWKLSSGVRKKGKIELSLGLKTTANPQYELAVKEVANQIRELGIKVDVEVVDTSAPGANFVQDTLQQRNYDLLVYELPIGADPDVYAYWHSSQLGSTGYNFTNYSNDLSDAALASARDRLDETLRRAKYIAFAKQWITDVPAVGLYQQVSNYAHFNRASAMEEDAKLVISSDRYANVTSWTVRQESVYKTP